MNTEREHYITIHAIDRFAQRKMGHPEMQPLSKAQIMDISSYLVQLLEEHYPEHMKLDEADFHFKEFDLILVKNNGLIVTAKDYVNNYWKKKDKKRKKHGKDKTYVKGEYRIRDKTPRDRNRSIQRGSYK